MKSKNTLHIDKVARDAALRALGAVLGGGLPLLCISAGTWEAATAGAAVLSAFLPWHKAPEIPVRCVNGASAAVISVAAACLIKRYTVGVPLWQIGIAVFVFAAAVSRIGRRSICRALATSGGAAGATLVVMILLCMFRGGVGMPPDRAPVWQTAAAAIAFFGAPASILHRESSPRRRRAARWGAVSGAALWGGAFAAAAGFCKGCSLYPITAAWRRVTLLGIFYCPDVPAAALLVACALQTAALAACSSDG